LTLLIDYRLSVCILSRYLQTLTYAKQVVAPRKEDRHDYYSTDH